MRREVGAQAAARGGQGAPARTAPAPSATPAPGPRLWPVWRLTRAWRGWDGAWEGRTELATAGRGAGMPASPVQPRLPHREPGPGERRPCLPSRGPCLGPSPRAALRVGGPGVWVTASGMGVVPSSPMASRSRRHTRVTDRDRGLGASFSCVDAEPPPDSRPERWPSARGPRGAGRLPRDRVSVSVSARLVDGSGGSGTPVRK